MNGDVIAVAKKGHFPSQYWEFLGDDLRTLLRRLRDPLARIEKVIENALKNYLGTNVFEGGCFLLNALVDYCFPIVHKVGANLRHIEENLFNNNVLVMPVSARRIGLTNANPRFDYQIVSFSREEPTGAPVDATAMQRHHTWTP